MTPWREFAAARLDTVLPSMRGRMVLDPLGVLPERHCQQLGYQYQRMGA